MPSYASTQLNLPGYLAERCRQAAMAIQPRLELETLPHVTVLYGLDTDDPELARSAVAGLPALECALGATDCFGGVEGGTRDAVYVAVEGAGLADLRQRLQQLPRLDTSREYVPHVTLAYVPLGDGPRWRNLFLAGVTGATFTARELVFSGRKQPDGSYAQNQLPLRSYAGGPGNEYVTAWYRDLPLDGSLGALGACPCGLLEAYRHGRYRTARGAR